MKGRSFLAGDAGTMESCCISPFPGLLLHLAADPTAREGKDAFGTPYAMSRVCRCTPCFCEHRGLWVLGGRGPRGPPGRGRGGVGSGAGRAGEAGLAGRAGGLAGAGLHRREASHVGGKVQGQIHIKEEDEQGSSISPSPSDVVKCPFFFTES